jgi:hypothetical protein
MRLAILDDVPALRGVMDAAIAELQRAFSRRSSSQRRTRSWASTRS